MSRPSAIGLICARGGSKGVARKNLRLLGGKPLIGWAIETARNCPSLDRVIVSTEDAEIADVARQLGAEIPFVRPSELAQDGSPELLVWKHALKSIVEQDGRMPDLLVNLPATSPFRAIEDVEACIRNLVSHSADLCITVRHAHRSPYFNMVSLNDGWAQLVIKPATPIVNRQAAPEVFEITTVAYAASASYVVRTNKLLGDRVCATIVPEDRSLDIDTELDMAFAEFLWQQKEKSYSRSV
jgi:N,N'-diacetyl-8-epilegionaminate cytidylyltransferase